MEVGEAVYDVSGLERDVKTACRENSLLDSFIIGGVITFWHCFVLRLVFTLGNANTVRTTNLATSEAKLSLENSQKVGMDGSKAVELSISAVSVPPFSTAIFWEEIALEVSKIAISPEKVSN